MKNNIIPHHVMEYLDIEGHEYDGDCIGPVALADELTDEQAAAWNGGDLITPYSIMRGVWLHVPTDDTDGYYIDLADWLLTTDAIEAGWPSGVNPPKAVRRVIAAIEAGESRQAAQAAWRAENRRVNAACRAAEAEEIE